MKNITSIFEGNKLARGIVFLCLSISFCIVLASKTSKRQSPHEDEQKLRSSMFRDLMRSSKANKPIAWN